MLPLMLSAKLPLDSLGQVTTLPSMQKSREIEIYKNGTWSVCRFDQLQEGDIFRVCGFMEHTWRVARRGVISTEVEPFLGAEHLGKLRKQMSVELDDVEHGSVGIESVTLDQEIGDARFYTIRTTHARAPMVHCNSTLHCDAGTFAEIEISADGMTSQEDRAMVMFEVSGCNQWECIAVPAGRYAIQVVIWRTDNYDEVVLYEQEDDQ